MSTNSKVSESRPTSWKSRAVLSCKRLITKCSSRSAFWFWLPGIGLLLPDVVWLGYSVTSSPVIQQTRLMIIYWMNSLTFFTWKSHLLLLHPCKLLSTGGARGSRMSEQIIKEVKQDKGCANRKSNNLQISKSQAKWRISDEEKQLFPMYHSVHITPT